MKKLFVTIAATLLGVVQMNAMSESQIRENARFLSDRMAYELNLTPQQYEDCFEINYDFISSINPIMDDVCYGYDNAIDRYYGYLDYRNDDLRYIFSDLQYRTFMGLDYFFRPIYTSGLNWLFRIHQRYTNHGYYYYNAPGIYYSYHGGHARHYYHDGFYHNRYHHNIYNRPYTMRGHHNNIDFGHGHPGGPHPGGHHDNGPRPGRGYYGNGSRPGGNYHNGGHHDGGRHDNGHRPDNQRHEGGHPGGNYNHNSNHNSNQNHGHNGGNYGNGGGSHSGGSHSGGSHNGGGSRGGETRGGGSHGDGPRPGRR